MEAEPFGVIRVDEVLQTLEAGEIIEEYPEDQPYASCLVLGRTVAGRPLLSNEEFAERLKANERTRTQELNRVGAFRNDVAREHSGRRRARRRARFLGLHPNCLHGLIRTCN